VPFPPKTDTERILRSAIEIVEKQGWKALSMRELGRRLNVRASSLYHHFADREAIEHALGRMATRRLFEVLQAAGASKRGTLKVLSLSEAYIRFATGNAALYHLIALKAPDSESDPDATALWNLFLDAMSTVTGRSDDTAAVVALWAFLHGYVALSTAGNFAASGDQAGFERGVKALLDGLAKKQNIL